MCFACELYSAATTTAQRASSTSAAYDVRSGGGSYISTPPDSADGREREREGEMGLVLVGIGHTTAALPPPRLFLPGWLLGYNVLLMHGIFVIRID